MRNFHRLDGNYRFHKSRLQTELQWFLLNDKMTGSRKLNLNLDTEFSLT